MITRIILPDERQNPNGLHQRYAISRLGIRSGNVVDDSTRFVLRLDTRGSDRAWVEACRAGLRVVARVYSQLKPIAKAEGYPEPEGTDRLSADMLQLVEQLDDQDNRSGVKHLRSAIGDIILSESCSASEGRSRFLGANGVEIVPRDRPEDATVFHVFDWFVKRVREEVFRATSDHSLVDTWHEALDDLVDQATVIREASLCDDVPVSIIDDLIITAGIIAKALIHVSENVTCDGVPVEVDRADL